MEHLITKTIDWLNAGHHKLMNIDRDVRRTSGNCDNCLDTEQTPVQRFDCTVTLAALQEIGHRLSSKNLYVDNVAQSCKVWIKSFSP
ncbi:hypothetical protein TNCV_821371 [Trichonephila clavipes]|nr:hypothetical protein TNCV_821371 [Trichonephila clavipes]